MYKIVIMYTMTIIGILIMSREEVTMPLQNYDYELVVAGSAKRDYGKFLKKHPEMRKDLQEALASIRANPYLEGSRKMEPTKLNRYRYKEKNFRILYTIDKAERKVKIFRLGDRKMVYQDL